MDLHCGMGGTLFFYVPIPFYTVILIHLLNGYGLGDGTTQLVVAYNPP
jgi:hypothetical protein